LAHDRPSRAACRGPETSPRIRRGAPDRAPATRRPGALTCNDHAVSRRPTVWRTAPSPAAATKRKPAPSSFRWWQVMDSNHRRLSRRLQTSPKHALTCEYVPRFRTSPAILRAIRTVEAGPARPCPVAHPMRTRTTPQAYLHVGRSAKHPATPTLTPPIPILTDAIQMPSAAGRMPSNPPRPDAALHRLPPPWYARLCRQRGARCRPLLPALTRASARGNRPRLLKAQRANPGVRRHPHMPVD
jgi:hypothetical protein